MVRSIFFSILFFFLASPFLRGQSEHLLIKNIHYIDVLNGRAILGDVAVQDGRIIQIGTHLKTRDGVMEIDGSNRWLIPGLVDAHIHLFQSGGIYTRPDVVDLTDYKSYPDEIKWLNDHASDLLKRYLRCGITTVIDVGGPFTNYAIRDRYKDLNNYPNLFVTGPLVSTYQPKAFDIEDAPIIKVNSKQEAIALVQKQLPYEPDFIKIWYIVLPGQSAESTYDIIEATIRESHKNGLKVAVHATQLETAKLAMKAGADILVHSVDDPVDDDFIRLIQEKDVVYIPTLIVHGKYVETLTQRLSLTMEDFLYSNPFALGSLSDPQHYPKGNIMENYPARAPKMWSSLERRDSIRGANLKRLSQLPIVISTGTDAGNIGTLHGSSYFTEIDLMKKAGLSNAQILKASTINGAKVLGKEQELGSVTKGKIADLVILNANPLEDINALKDIQYVIKSGHLMAVDSILDVTPEILVQQQLNAYNAKNIDAFLAPYSDDVTLYNFPNEIIGQGKEAITPGYRRFFSANPNLHCEIVERILLGNTVIDHERVTGLANGKTIDAVAIYKIEHNKISKVYFIRKN